MGFRTDIRRPACQSTLSSTATVLGSVSVTPPAGRRVCVTGFWLFYNSVFTVITPQPKILSGSNTIYQMPAITSSTSVAFFNPVCGEPGATVTVQATCTAAGNTLEVGCLYYLDD